MEAIGGRIERKGKGGSSPLAARAVLPARGEICHEDGRDERDQKDGSDTSEIVDGTSHGASGRGISNFRFQSGEEESELRPPHPGPLLHRLEERKKNKPVGWR